MENLDIFLLISKASLLLAIWFLFVIIIKVLYAKISIYSTDVRVRYTALAITVIIHHFLKL